MLVIKFTSISVLKDWVFLPLPLPFPLVGGAADACDLTSVEVTDASRVIESVVYMVSSHNIIKQDLRGNSMLHLDYNYHKKFTEEKKKKKLSSEEFHTLTGHRWSICNTVMIIYEYYDTHWNAHCISQRMQIKQIITDVYSLLLPTAEPL